MDKNLSSKPIGIFDSGVGGLTVYKALSELMPLEQVLYFGDTAHMPYGEKSAEAIIEYSLKISEFLYSKGVKILIIACNSASSVAHQALQNHWGSRLKIFNVIDPVVEALAAQNPKSIGIIGTKATIKSGVYARKLRAQLPDAEVFSKATPLLAGMIEEGLAESVISKALIKHYFDDTPLPKSEALILGCTHYPLIHNEIEEYLNHKSTVVDSPAWVAAEVKKYLNAHQLSQKNTATHLPHEFFLSDYTEAFVQVAEQFTGKKIAIQSVKL